MDRRAAGPPNILVVEVGGTTIRAARYAGAGRPLLRRRSIDTPNHLLRDAPGSRLDDRVTTAIEAVVDEVLDGSVPAAIGLAWPGPVSPDGRVLASPTVFGSDTGLGDVGAALRRRWPAVPLTVVNDLTAAGRRYVSMGCRDFAILTVGSGIGHKVFLDGRPQVGPHGRGGELGHLRVDRSPDAVVCECGGRGHLGGLASGRGTVTTARRHAAADPAGFRNSLLAGAARRPSEIDGRGLAEAFRAGDALAAAVVRESAEHLALGLAALHVGVGLECFIVIGGFAAALGEPYRQTLVAAATGSAWDLGQSWDDMIRLGEADDNSGLIGVGVIAADGLDWRRTGERAVRVAVVGGGTPFVAGLVEARLAAKPAQPGHLVLHGRDERSLDVVSRYARARLASVGWRVSTTRDLTAALDGAAVVIHQPRYGGLAGRSDDERLASAIGVPADETLGPGGLQAALRSAACVRDFAVLARATCPDAVVLNLTNPLSVTTGLLAGQGVTVFGLCELPQLTARRAALTLGAAADQLEWSYAGLNHRGFLYAMRLAGHDLRPLPAALAPGFTPGVDHAVLAEVGVLPLKYFDLSSGAAPHGAGRAGTLERIRAQLLRELTADHTSPPAGLGRRDMPWYPISVIPVLDAVTGAAPLDTVLNLAHEQDGLVREVRAVLRGRLAQPSARPEPPTQAREWVRRFEDHERAVLAAVADPTPDRLREALELDPLVPADRVEAATTALCRNLRTAGSV